MLYRCTPELGFPLTDRNKKQDRTVMADHGRREELVMTDRQWQRMEQIALEFGALLGLADTCRLNEAALDMLKVFVEKGKMSIDQAIDILATTMTVTREKMAGPSPRH